MVWTIVGAILFVFVGLPLIGAGLAACWWLLVWLGRRIAHVARVMVGLVPERICDWLIKHSK